MSRSIEKGVRAKDKVLPLHLALDLENLDEMDLDLSLMNIAVPPILCPNIVSLLRAPVYRSNV
ncbi:hypothetical protein [Spirochaeta dissipatitropha]